MCIRGKSGVPILRAHTKGHSYPVSAVSRRTTTPTFERGHTGLPPPPPPHPGKRQCLDAKDGDGVGVGRRLSIESVESMACSVFSGFGRDGLDGLQWQPGGDRREAAANNSLLSDGGA